VNIDPTIRPEQDDQLHRGQSGKAPGVVHVRERVAQLAVVDDLDEEEDQHGRTDGAQPPLAEPSHVRRTEELECAVHPYSERITVAAPRQRS
jgi:hypothetical protein